MRTITLALLVASSVACGPAVELMPTVPAKRVSDAAAVCASTCRSAGYADGQWCACAPPTLTCVCHDGLADACTAAGCTAP